MMLVGNSNKKHHRQADVGIILNGQVKYYGFANASVIRNSI